MSKEWKTLLKEEKLVKRKTFVSKKERINEGINYLKNEWIKNYANRN